ncbi:MAG: hypothetical protein IT204_09880 [Fimbriimonadaceae bacterium]|nr:hypothetical protein [Fimbriimonadaceae bacterium]
MDDLSLLAAQELVADQHTATALLLLLAIASFACCQALFRRQRFPHRSAWLVFCAWTALVALVPRLRELDQANVWFYSLRGLPLGALIGSMTRFAELTPRRAPATPADPAC